MGSKRSLEEDPLRRTCLRQCHIDDGRMRPTFDEWEQFCRDTAAMKDWDNDCETYFGCIYGCDIWGGSREQVLDLTPSDRYEFLIESKANMYASGVTPGKRCSLEKCHAYCARESFNTCREMQFVQKCEDGNPQSYGCDVRCNDARKSSPLLPIALASLLVSLRLR